MSESPRPSPKASVIVRLAKPEDIAQITQIHSVINRAYRSEGGWTTEAHLVSEERCSIDELKGAILDKVNPLLLAFDSETNEPLGTLQLDPAETYPDFGEYKAEGYNCTHVESTPKDQQIFVGLFSVDPLQQSRGIGRKLVDEALRHAKESMGRKQAVVYVILQRPELVSWYKKLGFVDYGEKVPFPDASRIKQEDIHFSVLRLAL
ncbi:hypothetical protein EMPS_09726 [Entomortierella parvispora]|uniref:N-acetyltransferase domain-containing protein n=1 Tax=Entomortierella parvispora TaxID=205924 RepID=A0A9P3HIQ2_9FUNG|nr:hypothetical protein EMPS_09726 [Entomortierella parvispora]